MKILDDTFQFFNFPGVTPKNNERWGGVSRGSYAGFGDF
jgi:hypothetical protein